MLADPLAVYLNDHVAAAAGGVALAKRLAGNDPSLSELAHDIQQDRRSLLEIMADLGVRRTYYKEPFAVLGERVARLKPNGTLLRRSIASDLIELEAMATGVSAKRSGWRTLREVASARPEVSTQRIDELIHRADDQLELLETKRTTVAASLARR